jgi:hypothetical protein
MDLFVRQYVQVQFRNINLKLYVQKVAIVMSTF